MGQVSTNGELKLKKKTMRGGYFACDPERNETKMPPENSGKMQIPGELEEEMIISFNNQKGYISEEAKKRLKDAEEKRIAEKEIRKGLERKGINR